MVDCCICLMSVNDNCCIPSHQKLYHMEVDCCIVVQVLWWLIVVFACLSYQRSTCINNCCIPSHQRL